MRIAEQARPDGRRPAPVLAQMLLTALGTLLVAGCASPGPGAELDPDPWEGFNRSMFSFNEGVDEWILEPAGKGWTAITNEPIRRGTHNFFTNIRWPVSLIGNLAQGELLGAGTETARFLINTTVGIVGIFDPATHWGIEARVEDTGQAFGAWGFDAGPYLVLPILGPSSGRDALALPIDLAADPVTYYPAAGVLDRVNWRARNAEAIKDAKVSALDFYVFVRDAYLQRRASLVRDEDEEDGASPDEAASDDDLYDDGFYDDDLYDNDLYDDDLYEDSAPDEDVRP